jgi:RHS repeat-associated protein
MSRRFALCLLARCGCVLGGLLLLGVCGVAWSHAPLPIDALLGGPHRRLRATLADGSAWSYDYNDRNELVSAKRVWPDHAPVAGQQFEFGYDPIGNRTSARSGGDTDGLNLRSVSYSANNLNQYTTVTTPGYEAIVGVALATNLVTVNSLTADRKGEYFHRELAISNGSGPVWQAVSVVSGGQTNSGNFLFPPYTQNPTYDEDGNLKQDGLWLYSWDAENRLKAIESVSAVPSAAKRKLEFGYDFLGRRIWRKVYTWSGSWVLSSHVRFVQDGWNLIAELNALSSNAPVRSYLWGQDVSGTMDAAGGIGGLLVVRDHGGGTYHFVGVDGNGNATALVNASDQSPSARYEYSPFGELIRATGPLAMGNPFRWSTKFWEEEAGLVYYGYRYYAPSVGRWINRDPTEEQGGNNLYAFVANNPINASHPLGLWTLFDVIISDSGAEAGEKVVVIKRGESLVRQVREAVKVLDNIQQFEAGVLEAQGLDISELIGSINAAKGALAQGLRGAKSSVRALASVGNDHHIFPKAKGLAEFSGGTGSTRGRWWRA